MLYSEQMKHICEKLGVNPDTCPDGLYSTLLQTICDACDGAGGGGTSGGGAEIKTCNVRFVPHPDGMSPDGMMLTGADWWGMLAYTKCENGNISTVLVNGSTDFGGINGAEPGTDYDFTLENVVCGSAIYIEADMFYVDTIEAFDAMWDDVSGKIIVAPTESGVTATIQLAAEGGW